MGWKGIRFRGAGVDMEEVHTADGHDAIIVIHAIIERTINFFLTISHNTVSKRVSRIQSTHTLTLTCTQTG